MPIHEVPELDRKLGIEVYATDVPGIGGRIRERLEDFIVEEITKDRRRVYTSLTGGEERRPVQGVGKGDYTWFVLEKRNLDTISAIKIIAKSLGLRYDFFSVAGLKDSKAVTAQLVSVFNVDPDLLEGFKDKYGNIEVRHCVKMPFRIVPGMLYGNHFIIVVRNILLPEEEVSRRVSLVTQEIGSKGLPAFYGYQRFGTIRPNTHIIGKYILQGKFEDAVMELLAHPYPNEDPRVIELREYIRDTEDYRGALEKFPRALSHERTVLKHLSVRERDYIGALRKLPKTVRRLFISAYQSYLFNKCLSRRVKRGIPINEAVIGDLVAIKLKDGSLGGVVVANEHNLDFLNERIARGDMVLVLNVFGYGTIIQGGVQGDIEREVLKEENISLNIFKSKHMPEVATRGTYRRACFYPEELTVSNVHEDELNVGAKKVVFEFTLNKGLYATVVLREYMKPKDIVTAGF